MDIDVSIKSYYASKYLKCQSDCVLLHINHALDSIISFHKEISNFFQRSLFLVIPYNVIESESFVDETSSIDIVYIKANGCRLSVFHNNQKQCATSNDFHTQIKDLFSVALESILVCNPKAKIVIIEDGGYHYEVFNSIIKDYPSLERSVIGCVEQTKNGLRSYYNACLSGIPAYPVFSAARSEIKMRVESFFIANVCFNCLKDYFTDNSSKVQPHVILLGYGAIGRYFADILEENEYSFSVWDNDPEVAAVITEDHRRRIKIIGNNLFGENTIVVGATGNASFSLEMIDAFLNSDAEKVTLVSISSKQTEFQLVLQWLIKQPIVNEEIIINHERKYGTKYSFLWAGRKKEIFLLADGFPINFMNFVDNRLPWWVTELVFSEMIYLLSLCVEENRCFTRNLYLLGNKCEKFQNIENELKSFCLETVPASRSFFSGCNYRPHPVENHLRQLII